MIAELWKQSNGTRGFPGGQRPTVGISGYTLGMRGRTILRKRWLS